MIHNFLKSVYGRRQWSQIRAKLLIPIIGLIALSLLVSTTKMSRTFLRSLRVSSKAELKRRIEKYLGEVNAAPVVFQWKYKPDEGRL